MISVVGYMKVIPPGNKKPQKPLIIKNFIENDKMKLIISINPLVWWMWLGGPIFILGTLISLWPRNFKKP